MSVKRAWICALIVFAATTAPTPLFAGQDTISGLVQYTFEKDDAKNADTQSNKTGFIQEYDLRDQGNIYDPRFLHYNIGGGFIKDDSRINESRVGEINESAKSRNFNFQLDFLQGSKFPFTIYTNKLEQPAWTIQPQQIYQTKANTDSYGLSGTASLGAGTNLIYNVHEDDIKTSGGPLQQTDQANKSYLLGINSRKGDTYFNASYNRQNNFEKVAQRQEDINNAHVSFGLKPGTNMTFNTDASYYDNSYYQFSDTDSSTIFNYTPSSDFGSNFSLYATRVKQKEQTGNFATLSWNAFYKLNPFLTTTQDLTLYDSQGDFGNEATESLTLRLAFARLLPDNLTVSANTSLNGTFQQSNMAPQQTGTASNRNSGYYSVDGRALKLFTPINSEVNGGASFYSYVSSAGGQTTRYAADAGFISHYIPALTFQSLVNFSQENITSDELNGTSTVTKKTRVIFDNSLAYMMMLTSRGNLDAKVGTIVEHGTVPRTFNYVNSTIRYVPVTNLSLHGTVSYYREGLNSTSNLAGSLGADYRVRSLTMNLQNDWLQVTGPQGLTRRTTTFLRVSRPF